MFSIKGLSAIWWNQEIWKDAPLPYETKSSPKFTKIPQIWYSDSKSCCCAPKSQIISILKFGTIT